MVMQPQCCRRRRLIFSLLKFVFRDAKSSQGGGYIYGAFYMDGRWFSFPIHTGLGGFVAYKIGSVSFFELFSHGNFVLSWVKTGIGALPSVFFSLFIVLISIAFSLPWPVGCGSKHGS